VLHGSDEDPGSEVAGRIPGVRPWMSVPAGTQRRGLGVDGSVQSVGPMIHETCVPSTGRPQMSQMPGDPWPLTVTKLCPGKAPDRRLGVPGPVRVVTGRSVLLASLPTMIFLLQEQPNVTPYQSGSGTLLWSRDHHPTTSPQHEPLGALRRQDKVTERNWRTAPPKPGPANPTPRSPAAALRGRIGHTYSF